MKTNLIYFKRSEFLWTIGLALSIPVCLGFASELSTWFGTEGNGIWMKWLYRFLDNHLLVNIPICIVLVYFACCWYYKIGRDHDIRFFRPILPIYGLVLLWNDGFVYAHMFLEFDYRILFTCLLAISLLVMAVKLIVRLFHPMLLKKIWFVKFVKSIKQLYHYIVKKFDDIKTWLLKKLHINEEPSSNINRDGFIRDNIANEKIPKSLQDYAEQLMERLMATDISESSFAVGVTGEWGSGKTKFLELLADKCKGKAEVMEFNPWMCRTPEQLTQDFFASLRLQLAPKHSRLSNSIQEYAKHLSNFTLTSNPVFNIEMAMPIKKVSLYEKKKALSDKLKSIDRPVMVFIDDMDRLERDEIFEVLRLIRNTGDLSNVIYVVTFDKEYITSVLQEKNIKDASSYLEKIFPIEVHLPKVENQLIWQALYEDFTAQDNIKNGEFALSLINQFKADESELILRILDNYRCTKRFSRLFMMNMSYLNKQYAVELKGLDLFWLELLQMYDKKTYDTLSNTPDILLYVKNERYYLKKGIIDSWVSKETEEYKGEKFWKDKTPFLLEKIFNDQNANEYRSICYLEHYEKYFILGVSARRISIKERKQLFSGEKEVENIVNGWIDSGKFIYSITYQLKQIEVRTLNEENLKAYLHALLQLGIRTSLKRYDQIYRIKKMLHQNLYGEAIISQACDIIKSWVQNKIKNKADLLCVSHIMNCLYVSKIKNEDGQELKCVPIVINNKLIKNVLAEILASYLDNNLEVSALDIVKENSTLSKLFKNCCVKSVSCFAYDEFEEYEQIAYDEVIKYFGKKENKPTLSEFNAAYNQMFSNKADEISYHDSEDPEEYDNYLAALEYEGKQLEYKLIGYWGSNYFEKLEELKTKCFVVK